MRYSTQSVRRRTPRYRQLTGAASGDVGVVDTPLADRVAGRRAVGLERSCLGLSGQGCRHLGDLGTLTQQMNARGPAADWQRVFAAMAEDGIRGVDLGSGEPEIIRE